MSVVLALALSVPVGHPTEEEASRLAKVDDCARPHKLDRAAPRHPKHKAATVQQRKPLYRIEKPKAKPEEEPCETPPAPVPFTLIETPPVSYPPDDEPPYLLPTEPVFPTMTVTPLDPLPCECFAGPGVPIGWPVPSYGPGRFVALAVPRGLTPAVPEPRAVYLVAAGLLLLAWRRREVDA